MITVIVGSSREISGPMKLGDAVAERRTEGQGDRRHGELLKQAAALRFAHPRRE
jgi:hypothetical protein